MMDNIVGLARQQCPCADIAPLGYNTSVSGLYLTDLEPFAMLEGLQDCEQGGVWDMLAQARGQAIQAFQTDMVIMLSQRYKATRQNYKGMLGEAGGTARLETAKRYAGFRIYVGSVRGATLKIKRMGTVFSNAGFQTVYIYNNLNELLQTITNVETKSGTYALTDVDINLPMHNPLTSKLEYFFVYEYSSSNKAIVNKAHCGCGGFSPSYNTNNPYLNCKHSGQRAWAQWVMIGSYEADTLTEFADNCTRSPNRANGLFLDVEMYCQASNLLDDGSVNIEANPLTLGFAKAIQLKAAENLANKLLISTNPNRAVMINREQIAAMREVWKAEYLSITKYLASVLDVSQNDCFECKTDFKMSISPIFS